MNAFLPFQDSIQDPTLHLASMDFSSPDPSQSGFTRGARSPQLPRVDPNPRRRTTLASLIGVPVCFSPKQGKNVPHGLRTPWSQPLERLTDVNPQIILLWYLHF